MKLVHIINIYLFALNIIIVPTFSINSDYYPEERDALIVLRESLTSDIIDLHSRWTGPPCHNNDTNWVGVVCKEAHVVSLVLEGLHLRGSVSPRSLLNLTHLAELSLSNNSLHGPLPSVAGLVLLQSVSLNDNRFRGPIPPELAGLPRLGTLKLQSNSLYGPIPGFDQPSLRAFDVSYNELEGRIPDTAVLRRFPESSYAHNAGLCGPPLRTPCAVVGPPPPPPGSAAGGKGKRSSKWWRVGLIAGLACFVPLVVVVVWLCYYRVLQGRSQNVKELHAVMAAAAKRDVVWSPKSKKDPERGVNLDLFDKEMPVFDLDDLLRASAEEMGKGALGTTYKTTLETGQSLAVKRLKDMTELGKKEFVQQMQLLGKTCCGHENLVKIVSFYYSKDEKLVVSEFIPDGTLYELLHEKKGLGRVPLTWETRLSIIKDIAKGLKFLHQSLPHHKVPHANLKSTNILIQRPDPNGRPHFRCKLTDFGYLPLLSGSHRKPHGLAVARSPEHSKGRRLSPKADVYCLGIVILEIVTGRVPGAISRACRDKDEDLSDWVRMVVNTDWSTDILDAEIAGAREGHDEMLKLTEIALQCTDVDPEKRPTISEVLLRIQEIEQM